MACAWNDLELRRRVSLQGALRIFQRDDAVCVAVNQQHIPVVGRDGTIDIVIQKRLKVGAPHIHPHEVVGFGDLLDAFKEAVCLIHHHKGRVEQHHPANLIRVGRAGDGRDRPALTAAHQKEVVAVHIVQLLYHRDDRFQVRLFGEEGHLQGGAVAAAAGASAAEVKAVDHIPLFGQRFGVGAAHRVGSAKAVGKDDRRHFVSGALRDIQHAVNPVFSPLGVKLLRLIGVGGFRRRCRLLLLLHRFRFRLLSCLLLLSRLLLWGRLLLLHLLHPLPGSWLHRGLLLCAAAQRQGEGHEQTACKGKCPCSHPATASRYCARPLLER